jgi:hypothetical protein
LVHCRAAGDRVRVERAFWLSTTSIKLSPKVGSRKTVTTSCSLPMALRPLRPCRRVVRPGTHGHAAADHGRRPRGQPSYSRIERRGCNMPIVAPSRSIVSCYGRLSRSGRRTAMTTAMLRLHRLRNVRQRSPEALDGDRLVDRANAARGSLDDHAGAAGRTAHRGRRLGRRDRNLCQAKCRRRAPLTHGTPNLGPGRGEGPSVRLTGCFFARDRQNGNDAALTASGDAHFARAANAIDVGSKPQ